MDLGTIWQIINSPIGYSVFGFFLLFVINKIFDAKPKWAKYEGLMISAIKNAEKWIPNDSDSGILNKADKALDFFIKSYEKAKGKSPSMKLKQHVQLGLPIVHDKVEHMMKTKELQQIQIDKVRRA